MYIHVYVSSYKRTYICINVYEYVYMKQHKYVNTKVRIYISIPSTRH